MKFDPRNNMDNLNSATKYPSILTYHALDPKNGMLLEDQPTIFTGPVMGTEKIDGTNGRITLLPDGDWFIGSREEFIYAKGDRIRNPELSIVPTLAPIAETLVPTDEIRTYFFEVYGGAIGGAWRNYTTDKTQTGARLFDVHVMPEDVYTDVLSRPREHISIWRDRGGQSFLPLGEFWKTVGTEVLDYVPLIVVEKPEELPTTLQGMRDFLGLHMCRSMVALDDAGSRKPEGLILRSIDRSTIAKARIQDYDRTLRRMSSQGKS